MRAKAKSKKPLGYVFWPYDLFPHLLGGEFVEIRGASVVVPSYGANACVKPLFILGMEEGKALCEKLEALTASRRQAMEAINQDFSGKLRDLVNTAGGRLKRTDG